VLQAWSVARKSESGSPHRISTRREVTNRLALTRIVCANTLRSTLYVPLTAATARTSAATPRRIRSTAGYLSPTKSQLLRTPGTVRQARNIPSRPPLRGPSPGVRNGRVTSTLAHPASPSKTSSTPQSSRRPPSSATFNPAISNGVPAYPNRDTNSLKQKGNSVWNPHYFGNAGELPGVREETECGESGGGDVGPGIRRPNSITVRRQPSSVDFHSRPDQTAVRAPPDGQPSRLGHLGPIRSIDRPATGSLSTRQPFPAQVQVTVPTVDGFFLEFNPLLVSPNALNELEGITEDAKKQAREEMVRLVKEAVSKWTI